MNCGFLYIAIGKRYLVEAETSARSLRRFSKYPFCLVTSDTNYRSDLFEKIINIESPQDFIAKIIGMQQTPFDKTIFLDSDTFVCSSIDHLFDGLNLFDMCMTVENAMHGYSFFKKYNPDFNIAYETVIPEFNTGIIVYSKTENVMKLLKDWLHLHNEMHIKADMPSFREAMLQNTQSVRISPIPVEYNFHGILSFGFAYNEIKIIHERLGEKWNTLTTIMLPYNKMERVAKKINRFKGKRLIVPYIGVIPYTYSPYKIKYKIKQLLGIKKTKKAETF